MTAARIFAKRKEEKTEQLSAELSLVRQGSISGRSTSPTLVPDPSSPVSQPQAQALAQQRDALLKEVRTGARTHRVHGWLNRVGKGAGDIWSLRAPSCARCEVTLVFPLCWWAAAPSCPRTKS